MSIRILGTARGIAHQVRWGLSNAADFRSFLRYSSDVILYHVLAVRELSSSGNDRSIYLRGGVELRYRLNRGDIQGIREVWVDEVYHPCSDMATEVIVDLGANIGLTSVYLARRHGASSIVAVEPAPENCRIARINFARNGVPGLVVQAAIGPAPGIGFFQSNRDSNVGRLAAEGSAVRVITMPMLMERLPGAKADLVKMDIEGGEGALLTYGNGWLDSVASVLAEFHPSIVECDELIDIMTSAGFTHRAPGTNGRPSVECFTRVAV